MERELRTVVLVDGSATMLYYHSILLKRLSYVVRTAASAEDALAVLAQTPPSLVLTEISLPRMSGLNFIKAMKDSDRTRDIPVIVLTGEDNEGTKAACLGLGCAGYLVKPVDASILYRVLQAAAEPVPRSHIRLATSLEVVVGDGTALGGMVRTEHATAISSGGLFIRTEYPQPRNTLIPLRISFPGREVPAKAVTLYTIKQQGKASEEPGMGMKFVEISEQDRIFIQEFIQQQLTRGIEPGSGQERLPGAGG